MKNTTGAAATRRTMHSVGFYVFLFGTNAALWSLVAWYGRV
jgi:hypothetical protein